ncbi:magnesium transporter [Vibrio sp. Isolate30]|uniref:magnesium transporter n=1 Tax=Vibrio sp. Isolate30 TaxID=2908536 RepID=UPI001EFED5FB|nr:magnesium transporter [Vibrio sp. Isolate30]MCG9633011.1 magnesium transporter [Vibrio sp. Isolate30]
MQNTLTNIAKFIMKWSFISCCFVLFSYGFALLTKVHGTDLPSEHFTNGLPVIIGLLDSELFMGVIFVITLCVVGYVIYLLWQLHEIAVHKAEKINSKQANLVFALSLCGLFLHKAWWVLAVAIAFTDWVAISTSISAIIYRGVYKSNEEKA